METNHGDNACPKIRSRLVAREMRLPGEEAVFAPTPPLETLRMVLSHAVTHFDGEPEKIYDPNSEHRQHVLLIDIRQADFNAPTSDEKPTYVELPPDLGAPPGMWAAQATYVRHETSSRGLARGVLTGIGGHLIRTGISFGVLIPTCVAWDCYIRPRGRLHRLGEEVGSRLVAS